MEEFDHDEKAFAQSSGSVAASGAEPQGYPVERICPPAGHNVPGPLGPPPITCSIQCLCKLSGQWIQLDMIQDISLCGDDVFSLASRFNTLQLSPLHFRNAVLDSVS